MLGGGRESQREKPVEAKTHSKTTERKGEDE